MPTLVKQQRQKLVELGEQLRQKREEQALSLTEIASKTLIRKHLIEAIEAGKLEQLPEPIYVSALIRQYINALGLEAELLNSFAPSAPHTLANVQPARKITLPLLHLRSIHIYLVYLLVIVCSTSVVYLDLKQKQLLNSERSEFNIIRKGTEI